ncbi:MAG: C40 family peptidase [Clostridiales bacterium]|nr:C40 family peptidase [Clostridiales bacterium]
MKAVVITDICPLYKEQSLNSELADEVLHGMAVDVLGEDHGFWRVRTHYNYDGYAVPNTLLDDVKRVKHWHNTPKWTVWSPYLDIKTSPSVHARTIVSCPRGGLLERLDSDEIIGDGYTEIGLPDGSTGFVRKPCVAPEITSWDKSEEKSARSELIRTAKLYLGDQYRWGGKTPLGIDCSGLTSMAYLLNGVLIYRDADIRPGFEMKEIPFEDKQPGDLIFFKGHVAMYLGNNEFIHSTAHPSAIGVVINSFDPASPAYRGDLLEKVLKAGTIF